MKLPTGLQVVWREDGEEVKQKDAVYFISLTNQMLSSEKKKKEETFAHKTGQSTKVKFPSGLETHVIQSDARWDSGRPDGSEGPAEPH